MSDLPLAKIYFRGHNPYKFCDLSDEFIYTSSIVMVPNLKTGPMADGQGDDNARAEINRPSFVESFTLQLSRKGVPGNFGLICRMSAVL